MAHVQVAEWWRELVPCMVGGFRLAECSQMVGDSEPTLDTAEHSPCLNEW